MSGGKRKCFRDRAGCRGEERREKDNTTEIRRGRGRMRLYKRTEISYKDRVTI